MMKIALIGWAGAGKRLGNVSTHCKEAIEKAPDMELAGVVTRRPDEVKKDLPGVEVSSSVKDLGPVDAAVLAIPSRAVPDKAREILELGISTVDSYDEHPHLYKMKQDLDAVARRTKAVAVSASGWDPGSDSLLRVIFRVIAPDAPVFTTFGGKEGGKSMGHSVAARAIPGIRDAISMTLEGDAPGAHKRRVFAVLEEGATREGVYEKLKADEYFGKDPLELVPVPSLDDYDTLRHGVKIESVNPAGSIRQEYTHTVINPEATANVMIASARAACINRAKGNFGAFTMAEFPLVDLLPGNSLEEKLKGY